MTIRDDLMGTWKLADWKVLRDGTYEDPVWGPACDWDGLLIYDRTGYMSATLSRRQRARFVSDALDGGTDAEKRQAYDTFLSYCGRYEIRDEEQRIEHDVELSSFPNFTGQSLIRLYELAAGQLTLTIPTVHLGGAVVGGYIRWARP